MTNWKWEDNIKRDSYWWADKKERGAISRKWKDKGATWNGIAFDKIVKWS